jgi:hypothetical protein
MAVEHPALPSLTLGVALVLRLFFYTAALGLRRNRIIASQTNHTS